MEDSSCDPPLMVSPSTEQDNYGFYSISRDEYFQKSIPEFRNKKVIPTSHHGWVTLFDNSTSPINCSLYNTISEEKIELPPIELESIPTLRCILSKLPNDPGCHVLFVTYDNFILFCRVGDDRFVKRSSIFENEYLLSAASLKGKIYACMRRFVGTCTFVEVDFAGQEIILKRLVNDKGKTSQILEPLPKGFSFMDYLMEYCGELLFVSIYWNSCSMKMEEIRVFKITTSLGGEIEELRNIGDHAVLLSHDVAMSLLSIKDGKKLKNGFPEKNCIYYPDFVDEHLYVYDIDKQTNNIEKERCPTSIGAPSERCWFTP